jgi:hypothetical protein
LEVQVLAFMLALLDHPFGDGEYRNALVSGLAVLGIHEKDGWHSPLGYTPKLSAIVTVARVLVVYQARLKRIEAIEEWTRAGYDHEAAEALAPSHFTLVADMAGRFMTMIAFGGQPTPMDWILRLRTYGMSIRYSTNADGVVDWVGDTLLIGHIQFSMASLRSMVHGLVQTARVALRKQLLLLDVDEEGRVGRGASTDWPAVDWTRLVDNAAEMRTGWSFVDDPRNRAAWGEVEGRRWLGGRVAREAALRERFVEEDGGIEEEEGAGEGRRVRWKSKAIDVYGRAAQAFREQLLVLMHMTGGQPARGTELVTVQHKNGGGGEPRGLFVEGGMVVYVTMYHKSIGASAKAKVIHRYLPREVGELALYYVWLVLPFWRVLVRAGSGGRSDWGSAYIWEPKKEEPWAFPAGGGGRGRWFKGGSGGGRGGGGGGSRGRGSRESHHGGGRGGRGGQQAVEPRSLGYQPGTTGHCTGGVGVDGTKVDHHGMAARIQGDIPAVHGQPGGRADGGTGG